MIVLGIDPGRDKCGAAVCEGGRLLAKAIVAPADVPGLVARWRAEYGVEAIVVGVGTGSRDIIAALRSLPGPDHPAITVQEERNTTLEARRRYFADHPRRGWRRLVPLSLQVPPEAYDDYAAAVIADRYIREASSGMAV